MLELPLASSIRMYRNQHRRPGPPLAAPALEDLSEPGRIVAHKATGYSGSIRTWHGSGLMISQCSGDGTSLYREATHLGDSYDRYATMVLVHAGRFTGRQCGREAIARAGDIITLLPREVYESHTVDGTDFTVLYLPVAFLEYRGIEPDRLAAVAFAGGAMAESLRMLAGIILDSEHTGDLQQVPYLERAVLELAAGLLSHLGYAGPVGSESAPGERQRAIALIDAHFTRPGFDVDELAASMNISRRRLYRLFEGRGTSVAAMIRTRRLDEAERLLLTGQKELTLHQVARRCGFEGPDALSRAFKARTGEAPSQRRAARDGVPDSMAAGSR